jgi:hypothetical protein
MNYDMLVGLLYGIALSCQVYVCIQSVKAYKISKEIQESFKERSKDD